MTASATSLPAPRSAGGTDHEDEKTGAQRPGHVSHIEVLGPEIITLSATIAPPSGAGLHAQFSSRSRNASTTLPGTPPSTV